MSRLGHAKRGAERGVIYAPPRWHARHRGAAFAEGHGPRWMGLKRAGQKVRPHGAAVPGPTG